MKITRRQLRQITREVLDESSAEYTSINKPLDVQKAIGDIYERLVDLEDTIALMGGDIISFKQNVKGIEVEEPGIKRLASPDIIREAVVDNMGVPTREEARIALLNLQDQAERPAFSDIIVLANFMEAGIVSPDAALRNLKTLKTSPAILKKLALRLEGISFVGFSIVNDVSGIRFAGQKIGQDEIKHLSSEILSIVELSLDAGVSKIARHD